MGYVYLLPKLRVLWWDEGTLSVCQCDIPLVEGGILYCCPVSFGSLINSLWHCDGDRALSVV